VGGKWVGSGWEVGGWGQRAEKELVMNEEGDRPSAPRPCLALRIPCF
jgi:hypothetical protein